MRSNMAELALNPTSRASRSSHGYLAETATPGRKAYYVALPGTTCSQSVLNCKAIVEVLVPHIHGWAASPKQRQGETEHLGPKPSYVAK